MTMGNWNCDKNANQEGYIAVDEFMERTTSGDLADMRPVWNIGTGERVRTSMRQSES
jgi:hypothetical protein